MSGYPNCYHIFNFLLDKLEKGKQIDTALLSDKNEYKYMNGGVAESASGEVVTVSEGGASCGFVNYMDTPFWCGCHCYRLTDIVFPAKYLYYALKSNQDSIMALRTGSAMPNIKKSSFAQLEINLSESKAEQEKVVRNLEYVDDLICKRQTQFKLYESLVKSRFVCSTRPLYIIQISLDRWHSDFFRRSASRALRPALAPSFVICYRSMDFVFFLSCSGVNTFST